MTATTTPAESVINLYMLEPITMRSRWRSVNRKIATLPWLDDWRNSTRLLWPVGGVPLAEFELKWLDSGETQPQQHRAGPHRVVKNQIDVKLGRSTGSGPHAVEVACLALAEAMNSAEASPSTVRRPSLPSESRSSYPNREATSNSSNPTRTGAAAGLRVGRPER